MQIIDRDTVQLKKVRSFNDSNGFVNHFNVTGEIKSINRSRKCIELYLSKKSPHHYLEIEIEPSNIPARIRVGDMVTCTGFVRGGTDEETGGWIVRFRGKEINEVKIADLSDEALRDLVRRMEMPYAVEEGNERMATAEYRLAKRARRNGNYVGLSGFVEYISFKPGKQVSDDGRKGPDSVVMLIRQFEDKGLSVLVELNGREARQTYTGIGRLSMLGVPFIRFHGEAYIKVHDVKTSVEVVDEEGNPVLDEDGQPQTETQVVTTITPAIKAIASIEPGKPHHCRQPRTVVTDSGEERTEYPYPWTIEYKERAEVMQQKVARRKAPVIVADE